MTAQKLRFRQAATASGLLTDSQIDAALKQLKIEVPAGAAGKVKERQLAAKLVEMGMLNAWQADQLLNGRVKWNLGPYRIVDTIGQGGMGQVFKAEHTIMRRIVAIKVLPLSRSTPESIENFRREIQAQAQLDHENLVRAYDAGQDGNVHFLVTEYVPGLDLRRLIKRSGRLTQSAAAAVMCQAARGLEHAHARGLIHRDVKPGNLLVTPSGICKVSDLGLAGYLEGDETDGRRHKTVGTADYLSPEQILTPHSLTPAADVYSLGCTLYYAVTGKVPFPGGTTADKARAHCRETPIDPHRINSDLEPEFVDVIADLMAKDPADRIPNAAEVIRRLLPWAGDDWPAAAAGNVASPRPARTAGAAAADGENLDDTKPLLDFSEGEERESPSQVSDNTLPMASMSEETMPLGQPFHLGLDPDSGLSMPVLIAIGLGLTAAMVLAGAILYQLLT